MTIVIVRHDAGVVLVAGVGGVGAANFLALVRAYTLPDILTTMLGLYISFSFSFSFSAMLEPGAMSKCSRLATRALDLA